MSENITPSNRRIRINPEYASMIPKQSPEEYESLKQSIKEENGLYVPIIVNQNCIVLDGHHRYKACQELGIEPETVVKEFNNELDEQLFVIDCNLVRRQLNSFQKIELALKSKPLLEAIAKRNESIGGKGGRNLTPLGRVDEKIGQWAGVSRDTVRKAEKILENKRISDEVKEDLRLGKVSINEAYEKVELDRELQPLYQKMLKAREELMKSYAEIDNQPGRTKEEAWRRDYHEKGLEYHKACAALHFWVEYRAKKNSNIESVASQTLKEIASWVSGMKCR